MSNTSLLNVIDEAIKRNNIITLHKHIGSHLYYFNSRLPLGFSRHIINHSSAVSLP